MSIPAHGSPCAHPRKEVPLGPQGFGVVGGRPFHDHLSPSRASGRSVSRALCRRAAGDVGRAGQPQSADGEVAPGGHRPGCVACSQLRGVFGEGGVSDVVQGLGLPVVTDQGRELGGVGLLRGEAGDGADGLAVSATALDLDGLPGPGRSRPLTVATLIRRISERRGRCPSLGPATGSWSTVET
jgi:hypothetical protein